MDEGYTLQDIAFWNDRSTEHTRLSKHLKAQAQGHCLECNAEVKIVKTHLCAKCFHHLKTMGLEAGRVYFKVVGQSVLNYQQHLHRKFFGCNTRVEYRGLAKDRIRCDAIQEKTIVRCVSRLEKWLDKSYHMEQYSAIKDTRNFTRRLLFNQLLYGISFHVLNHDGFKSLAHYQATIIQKIRVDIQRCYIRKGFTQGLKRGSGISNRRMIELVNEHKAIQRCIQPLLVELLSDV